MIAALFLVTALSMQTPRPPEAMERLQQGNWEEAAQQAAELDTSSGLVVAAQATSLGAALDNQADELYKKAERYAQRAVQLDPNNAQAYLELGRAQNRLIPLSRFLRSLTIARSAKANLEKAISLQPNLASAYLELGMWHTLLDQRGLLAKSATNARRDQIVPQFEKALALEPNVVAYRLEYAQALLYLEQDAKAKAQLEQAVKLPAYTFWERRAQQQAKALLEKMP